MASGRISFLYLSLSGLIYCTKVSIFISEPFLQKCTEQFLDSLERKIPRKEIKFGTQSEKDFIIQNQTEIVVIFFSLDVTRS